jgi:exodeoxyribonuclease VII large subunit
MRREVHHSAATAVIENQTTVLVMDIDSSADALSKLPATPGALGAAASSAVVPVSLFVSSARLIIERHLGLTWISGEISGFSRAASGHCYFTLKDDRAQVRCVLFRNKAQLQDVVLKDGLAVEVRATPTIYEARGDFQLSVETVRLAGLGVLYERFAQLKAKLDAAGWFKPERKRALPPFPRAVGIVTSRHAAALRDVLTTLNRRMPSLPIILYPTPVQGSDAAAGIAAAIATANTRTEVDVLVVCRGGGSLEDLWAFNELAVARAVFESAIPVVSGVGHETDFTICDFVADMRAPTPTAAAALVAPERRSLLAQLMTIAERWRRSTERALESRMQRVDLVSRRLVHPAARLQAQYSGLSSLAQRLARAIGIAGRQREREFAAQGQRLLRQMRAPIPQLASLVRMLERWQRGAADQFDAIDLRIAALGAGMRHLNPQGVLDRGYSIVTTDGGAVVQDCTDLAVGDDLNLRFARGQAGAKVTSTTDS